MIRCLKDGLLLLLTTSLFLKLAGFTLFGLDFNVLLLKLETVFLAIDRVKYLFISLMILKAFLQWFWISRMLINYITEGLV